MASKANDIQLYCDLSYRYTILMAEAKVRDGGGGSAAEGDAAGDSPYRVGRFMLWNWVHML